MLLAGAVLLAVLLAGESSRAMLASARLSCSIPRWSSSVEFEYCDPGQLWHAGSQDTDLSCLIYTCTIIQSADVTERQTLLLGAVGYTLLFAAAGRATRWALPHIF